MFRSRKPNISITIAKAALETVFDECDRYEIDETGGRLVGTYSRSGNTFDIRVLGVLEPGPNAQRSPTSFFQDGDYQERVFRSIEESYPSIEHLGSWHTHHVNGYPTLSGGDKETYFKTVNHDKHNTDFFYALLVLRRTPGAASRYDVKHFVFFRNDKSFYEIPESEIRYVDDPVVWPTQALHATPSSSVTNVGPTLASGPNLQRVKDQEFFSEFYPNIRAMFSKALGAPYWKGALKLIDGSEVGVIAIEVPGGTPSYSVSVSGGSLCLAGIVDGYKDRTFHSARQSIVQIERDLNQMLFRKNGD